MSRIETVRLTFLGLWESAHSTILAQMLKSILSSGEDLVRIRLMPDIPDYLVFCQIKRKMKCHRKFDHAQIRCQMTTCFRN